MSASICWAAAEADTQFTTFDLSALKKQCLIFIFYLFFFSEHEYAYDKESHVGRLDKALIEAVNKGWTVVDMKQDWKVIHPQER